MFQLLEMQLRTYEKLSGEKDRITKIIHRLYELSKLIAFK